MKIISHLKKEKLINNLYIKDFISNLIRIFSKLSNFKSFSEWNYEKSLEFLEKLNPNFNFPHNKYWMLESMTDFIDSFLY